MQIPGQEEREELETIERPAEIGGDKRLPLRSAE
jgi:hypothetical protein